MKIFLSLVPSVYIVLAIIWDLGNTNSAYTTSGQTVVTAIVFCFVLWVSGYIAGKD